MRPAHLSESAHFQVFFERTEASVRYSGPRVTTNNAHSQGRQPLAVFACVGLEAERISTTFAKLEFVGSTPTGTTASGAARSGTGSYKPAFSGSIPDGSTCAL